MNPKKEEKPGFFPVMKWSNEYLLGLQNVTRGFFTGKKREHLKPIYQTRNSMVAMKRTRKRLPRFLPRHGRLMVR